MAVVLPKMEFVSAPAWLIIIIFGRGLTKMEFVSAPAWLIIIIIGRGFNSNGQMSDPFLLRLSSYFVKMAF